MKTIFKQLLSFRNLLNPDNTGGVLYELDDLTLNKLQDTLLQMYKDVLFLCKENDITPYLIGGSALGAIRHNGFIPWDDDLDIGMTRKDYNKFVHLFETNLSSDYVLNAPNYSDTPKNRFPKIFKKNTLFRDIFDSDDSLNGIFLDIFIIDRVPQNKLSRLLRGGLCNLLEFVSGQVYLFENDNALIKQILGSSGFSGKLNYIIRKGIGLIFSFRPSKEWFNLVDKLVDYKKDSSLFGICTGRKHYFGEIFDESILFPAKNVEFCDIDAPVFFNVEDYLENLYGNFMEIPPVEKREKHYLVEIAFEKD